MNTIDPTLTEDERAVVRKAIEILQVQGWTQGEYLNGAGQYCVIGALTAARGGHVTRGNDSGWNPDVSATECSPLVQKIELGLHATVGRLEDWETLPDWNDDSYTTKEEVIGVLTQFT